jgi:YVTN family beta-propeller protein
MTPRQVGHYRLDRLLGVGGMGEVYQAYDSSRDREVALKLLPEAFSDDHEYLQRFQRESHVAARLREPHVIPIHDFGEIDGRLFIDMRLVDGLDIRVLLDAHGPIGPPRTVRLLGQIAQALDAAHADGLVHRDVKPSNILVTSNDFVYVVDFGIVRSIGGGRQTTPAITGATIGTLDYMAPERFAGHSVDGRADIYSLACLLHECLTGTPPFGGKDLPGLMYAHLTSSPPPASSLADGVPPALDAVIARGMAKDPADRFPTAGALAAAAQEALRADVPAAAVPAPRREPVPAGEASGPGQGQPPHRAAAGEAAWRRRGMLALTGVVAAGIVIALVINFTRASTSSAAKTGNVTSASRAAGRGSVAPSANVPTVAAKIPVGKTPSYVQVAPNGKLAYVANQNAGVITVISTATDRVSGIINIPQGPPQFISFSPDSRTAYASVYNTSGSVHLVAFIDTATSTVTGTVTVNNGTPGPSATSPDGRYLYVPNHNMTMGTRTGNLVDVIDTSTRRLTDSIAVPMNPHWLVFSGKYFYTSDHMSGLVTVLNAQTNRIVKEIVVGETPHGEAMSPSGQRLAVTSFSGDEVFVVNTATDKVVAHIPVGRSPEEAAYAPDGRHLYTVNNADSTISVIDTATNRVTATIPAGSSPTSISVLPSGRQALVTNENAGTVEVLDIAQHGG